MEHFTTTKFKDIAEREVNFIRAQYDTRGIPIAKNCRYGKYFDLVEKLANSSSKEALQYILDDKGMGFIVTSLKDVAELYGVVQAFKNDLDDVYCHKLAEVIKGNEISDESETKTQPRDILWELNLGAHFKVAGFDTKLAEPDIVVKNNIGEIYIACKRPNSIKSLEKTIKGARRQIIKRGHGLLALSIDKLINPTFGILQGENMQEISGKIDRLLQDFIGKYSNDINGWIKDRKVFGAIYSVALIADDQNKNIFTICQKLYFTNLCPPASPYFSLIRSIGEAFKPISS